MGIYNFKDQFVSDIEADRKRHTIRAKRKHPDKPGNLLSLFVGLRTKKCRLLKRRRCVRVQDIQIFKTPKTETRIVIDDLTLSPNEKEALAISDGFSSFAAMMDFWQGRLPFHGDLIHWESDADAQQHEAEYSSSSTHKEPSTEEKTSSQTPGRLISKH